MKSTGNTRPMEILLVEDNPGDVRLTVEALRMSNAHTNLTVARDGVQAMAFLHREGEFVDTALPDLVLLDLNLPRKDGRQVLAEIKQDPQLKSIPVVVLTTSDARPDIVKCYGLYANCYVTKPVDLDQFTQVIQSIENFWSTVARLPSE